MALQTRRTLHSHVTPVGVSVGAFSVAGFAVMCIKDAVVCPVEFPVTQVIPSCTMMTTQCANGKAGSDCPLCAADTAPICTADACETPALASLLPAVYRHAGEQGPWCAVLCSFVGMRNPGLRFDGKMSLGDLRGFQKLIAGEGSLICLNETGGQCHMFVRREEM